MYQRLEQRMVAWMAGHGVALLRVSLGIVFLWFGALKFVPALCPAKDLACATMAKLTFGLLQPRTALAVLAVWETAVGLALILGLQLRLALGLLFLQMAGTLTPLFGLLGGALAPIQLEESGRPAVLFPERCGFLPAKSKAIPIGLKPTGIFCRESVVVSPGLQLPGPFKRVL